MPLMIVSEDDWQKEIEKPSNSMARVIEQKHKGRSAGDTNVSSAIRKIIADENLQNGRDSALQLAEKLHISPSSVSAYSHSNTSTASYHESDEELASFIKTRKNRIVKGAGRVLEEAIDSITDQKLQGLNPLNAARVARNMSGIIKDLEPPPDNTEKVVNNGPIFQIYAPPPVEESKFETIVVKE